MFYAKDAEQSYRFSAKQLRAAWLAADPARQIVGKRHPAIRKAVWLADGDAAAWRLLAEQRIAASPALTAHRETLCPAGAPKEHWKWLARAPEDELLRRA